ncbi:MAG: D-2-hydroxyacid dehydrogenase [Rhodospirillaceae bacterium]|jgi:phosphoglycerate dehydrogenase-like enzyme|nr:D-2-hydroxyacid dehydrogenase [Rhodospirillaceae bacterium]MBT5666472.1 D-2-hydroxyacid dehydrogenase [Rhodospirillaceae bacterium]MBT5811616.1 D-2-hydroxyacid dehydrogenase [Rhodospirillaceae bacterium]
MPVTVAMYDKSFEHIGERLDALGLDIVVRTFDKDSRFLIDGASVPPGEVDVDYFWLSNHVNAGGFQQAAFNVVLDCKSVGVLQTFNAGLDNPVYKKISDKGTRICNSSAQAVAISEYVMAHALSLIHPIDQQREQQAAKQWKVTPFREISRMNWLIVGFGPIGQEVAQRVKAFGATTTVVRRSPQTSDIVDKAGTMADLATYLREADVIVLACPLNAETRGFVNAGFFAALKKDAILINIARGALIDDAAMIAALDDNRFAAAVLDVFDPEPLPEDNALWSHPKVRVTPHTSFAGNGGRARWDQLFLDNITRFANGEPIASEVDPQDI